jgi:aspartate/methionine/tyrosine aminotransferase
LRVGVSDPAAFVLHCILGVGGPAPADSSGSSTMSTGAIHARESGSGAAFAYPSMIADRANAIDVSGIRRVFELGAKLTDPIDLSIGQPDFPVPDPLKDAAIEAIRGDRNRYTLTQGAPDLLRAVSKRLADNVGWDTPSDDLGIMVTSGTSGAIMLAFLALLNPGDEVIIPDPYFVIYPALARMSEAKAVYCDTYPDFRLTAERVEPLITDRTKLVLVNSPGNPSGVVLSGAELRDLAELCRQRGVLLISDEIYDEFTYAEAREDGLCPSPARFSQDMILVRGFGKSYGCTGWRMGYAAGPKPVIMQMMKLQQYSFVCAPAPAQAALAKAFEVDISGHVRDYQRKRDMVVDAFEGVAELVKPGGAFYAFVKVPEQLGIPATEFVERAIARNVLAIPGGVFSARDTHLRLSYATTDAKLRAGLDILRELASGE